MKGEARVRGRGDLLMVFQEVDEDTSKLTVPIKSRNFSVSSTLPVSTFRRFSLCSPSISCPMSAWPSIQSSLINSLEALFGSDSSPSEMLRGTKLIFLGQIYRSTIERLNVDSKESKE